MLVDMNEMGKRLQELASKSIKDKIEKGEAMFDEDGKIVFKDNPLLSSLNELNHNLSPHSNNRSFGSFFLYHNDIVN